MYTSLNAHPISKQELTDLITDGIVEKNDYLWIVMKEYFGRSIDSGFANKLFHFRITDIDDNSIEFELPNDTLWLWFEDYGINWEVWNICPSDEELNKIEWSEK